MREFMEDFRQEIYQELAEQRRQNEEHITYYAQQKLGPIPQGKQFIPTQTIPQQRPMAVKAGPPTQFAATTQPMGTVKPTAYSKSPVRQPQALQPQYQTLQQQQYQPPSYAKQAPGYAPVPQQHFYPPQSQSATKQPIPYRKSSDASPTAKGFRQAPMSAGQANRGYMPNTRVSGAFHKQAY